jgi:tRNA pseudouridine55 synthase
LKIGGKKLCDLAREGVTIEREAREVTVYSLSAEATDRADEFVLDVECSGGTYIRTLCADIGQCLGCGGVMAALERREACGIGICECATLDELEAMSAEERDGRLMPTEKLFCELDAVRLPAFFEKLFRDGCPIYQKKIKTAFEVGARVRVCDSDGNFFALGEVVEREEGSAVKSVKIFELR